MNIQFDEENQFDDDLLDFEEQQQNKIFEEVMKGKSGVEAEAMKGGIQDDADFILGKKQNQLEEPNKRKNNQTTEEQRKARELKILNARKYFQVAKLMYIKHICSALNQAKKLASSYLSPLASWLSMLSPEIVKEFSKIKKVKPLSIDISQLLQVLRMAKKYIVSRDPASILNWSQVFWSICEELKLGCRMVNFFNVDSIVEETFFQLKYQTSQGLRKRQNKKIKPHQIMKIQLSQQIEENFQAEQDSGKYLFLEDFEFDEASFKNKFKGIRTTNSSAEADDARREHNFLRKKNYMKNYFQVFDPSSDEWVLVNSQILQPEKIENVKKLVLEGKFIVGFSSCRILHFKPQFESIESLRNLNSIAIEDLTMFFEDNHRQLNSRRKRIGLKSIMKYVFMEGSLNKNRFLLDIYDNYIMDKNDSIELQYELTVFPKNKEQMLASTYFVVPSQLPQYCILDPLAAPLPNIAFNEQKVYLRRDVIAVTSKVHWIDRGRKVKKGELPVKKTENKSKNLTELFLFEQTEPFSLEIDQKTGEFTFDGQYNSIYVPTDFLVPPEMTIISKKVSFVCTRAHIRHAKIVQGFTRAAGRIVPNEIGFIIYKEDEELVMKLQEERQQKMEANKDKNRIKELTRLWNKLFKTIELSEWSRSFSGK